MRQLSLQQLTLRYALIILSLLISFSLISFISIKSLFHENMHEQQLNNLYIKAYNISVRLDFYRKIVHKLSLQNKTQELVVFGDVDEAQLWSQKTQQLIPDSVAVALFTDEGKILGLRRALRVGESCYSDLHNHIKNISLKKPPVHNKVAALAHFDLLKTITLDGEKIGILFTSIKLSSLQHLLNKLTEQGQHLALFSGDNKIIVESNYFVYNQAADKKDLHTVNIPIEGSDWYLQASFQESDLTEVLIDIVFINSLLFIALSIGLFAFSNRLVKLFSNELKTIHNLLVALKNHDFKITKNLSDLKETETIISDIQKIAEDISASQKQLIEMSESDELTGILNRRGFFNESTRCIELTKRDIESTLVLLDLDHFKQVNDNHGHAAGDETLSILSNCIQSSTRSIDIFARIGGDEFAIILVKCNYQQALSWYKNISESFQQQQKLKFYNSKNICTLSAGCAAIEEKDEDISSAMSRADSALYCAKEAGRANIKAYKTK